MIGLEMPQILLRMEMALDADLVRAFLSDCAGRDNGIQVASARSERAHEDVNTWLGDEGGHGRFLIPTGPTSSNARLARAIFSRLSQGETHGTIARALACHSCTIANHRRCFADQGVGTLHWQHQTDKEPNP